MAVAAARLILPGSAAGIPQISKVTVAIGTPNLGGALRHHIAQATRLRSWVARIAIPRPHPFFGMLAVHGCRKRGYPGLVGLTQGWVAMAIGAQHRSMAHQASALFLVMLG